MTAKETARAHVVIPRDLLAAVDRLVGSRKRSEFIVEAVRQRVRREQLGRALNETAGILDPADYPEWDTPEKTAAWVHESRLADDRRTEEKLRGHDGP